MSISLDSGFNTEFCLAMCVDSWRYRNNEDGFKADAGKYHAQCGTRKMVGDK